MIGIAVCGKTGQARSVEIDIVPGERGIVIDDFRGDGFSRTCAQTCQ